MDKLLVRFFGVRLTNSEVLMESAEYICGIYIKSYDRFFNLIESLKENDISIKLKNELHNIYLFEISYGGDPKEDTMSLDVYVI